MDEIEIKVIKRLKRPLRGRLGDIDYEYTRLVFSLFKT
jgi:hypothetical protein